MNEKPKKLSVARQKVFEGSTTLLFLLVFSAATVWLSMRSVHRNTINLPFTSMHEPSTILNTTMHKETSNIFNSSLTKFKFFIFQIGFMKAGTTSLADLFRSNGIPTIHFKAQAREKYLTLSMQMFSNYRNNKFVLEPYHNTYMYYGDFDVYAHPLGHYDDILFLNKSFKFGQYRKWFEILHKQYPNSKYILNIRNVTHWLRSRYTHSANGFPADKITEKFNVTYHNDTQVVKGWKKLWYQYICELLQYFHQNNIMDNLVIFDIENDNITKLVSFFNKYSLKLNSSVMMPHSFKTKSIKRITKRQFKKWNNIAINNPELITKQIEYKEIVKNCGVEI